MLALLPGGDPLEAALAAGETPSPELVAAASRTGDLSAGAAWACLLAVFGGIALVAFGFDATGLMSRRVLPRTPEWLAERSRVDRIAHVLTSVMGVVPGNRVLLRGPNSLHLAACWLAVMKAGAVAVTVLAAQRAHELRTVCAMGEVSHALCDAASLGELTKADIPGLRVTAFGGGGPEDLLTLCESQPDRYEAVATAADDVAMIAFTSGTTGKPKGCVHFHRDVLAVADTFSAHVLRPTPDDIFAGSPPLGFTFGLGGLVIFPLRAGASALLGQWSGPEQMLAAVERHRVTVLFTAPTAYRGMLSKIGTASTGAADGERTYDISSLRRCVSAGENLPAATYEAWQETTGLRMINGIGATEMLHIFVSAADGIPNPPHSADDEPRPVPNSTRPQERWSIVAMRSATRAGWFTAAVMFVIAVPTWMRLVRAATHDR